nr:hypothetical protein [Pseudomonas sivasensis]
MKRGDRVQVFEKKNGWVRICMDAQPAKWLSSKSLFWRSELLRNFQSGTSPLAETCSAAYPTSAALWILLPLFVRHRMCRAKGR